MKLLVLDIEGTLFESGVKLKGTDYVSTIWQGIASFLGDDAIKAEIATHKKWKEGKYKNYIEWMRDTILIHQKYGLNESQFKSLIGSAQYNKGVEKTLESIDRDKYEIVLISGGFKELGRRVQEQFNIKHSFCACEYYFDSNGKLDAFNLMPCDFVGKLNFINIMTQAYGLNQSDWIFVGDGTNDVPIAREANMSIGYNPSDDLAKITTYNLTEFCEILNYL